MRPFPSTLKLIELLGKAYLEAKRFDQAVDIFQRVLVASPEDFVSHVGMSIIADDQGKLDEAIWHMERAFEVQPSNAAIQSELQRLFGRRDGAEPPKIRLTRGALAHMYVQGDLFTQAISEIKAVLAHDPNRTDMQVLLGRAYFRNGQKAEAAEVCSALLAISPYCLDANRLMAEILPSTQATEAAREYRRRVCELDPYAEFAQGSIFDTDTAAEGAVTLQRLEYTGQPAEVGAGLSVGVAAALGSSDRAEAAPSWLTAARGTQPAPEPLASVEGGTPDFLSEAGWREVDSDEAGAATTLEAAADLEPAAPGDLPEWVRALAPSEERGQSSTTAGSTWHEPGRQEVNETSFPALTRRVGSENPTEEAPDWVRDLALTSDQPSESSVAPSSLQNVTPAAQPEIPFGRSGPATQPDDALAWLEGLAEKHGAKPEELLTAPESRPAAPPEWVDKLGQERAAAPEGWQPLREIGGMPDQSPPGVADRTPPASGEKPFDWLSGLADQDAFAEMEKPAAADGSSILPDIESSSLPAANCEAAGQTPGWLEGDRDLPRDVSSPVSRESPGEYESNVDLPDWLVGLDAEKTSGVVPGPAPSSQAIPDWLQDTGEAHRADAPTRPASDWKPAARDLGIGESTKPAGMPAGRIPA